MTADFSDIELDQGEAEKGRSSKFICATGFSQLTETTPELKGARPQAEQRSTLEQHSGADSRKTETTPELIGARPRAEQRTGTTPELKGARPRVGRTTPMEVEKCA